MMVLFDATKRVPRADNFECVAAVVEKKLHIQIKDFQKNSKKQNEYQPLK